MKRPSFQFYPGDWLNDAALRLCSVGARGLWIEMICLMHQGSDYGYLKVNHKVILTQNLSRIVGATLQEVEGWLTELHEAGVYSKDETGCIFSKRMIRDEEVRNARASGGFKGGNPALLGKNKVNLKGNLHPTPSSSSSSSSSSAKRKSIDLDYSGDFLQAWSEYPKKPGANKKLAFKAWTARITSGTKPETIIDGIIKYRKYCEALNTEAKFIKSAETFFGPSEHFLSDWDIPKSTRIPTKHDSYMNTLNQIFPENRNGTNRPIIDISPGRTIEGNGESVSEAFLGLREPDAG